MHIAADTLISYHQDQEFLQRMRLVSPVFIHLYHDVRSESVADIQLMCAALWSHMSTHGGYDDFLSGGFLEHVGCGLITSTHSQHTRGFFWTLDKPTAVL